MRLRLIGLLALTVLDASPALADDPSVTLHSAFVPVIEGGALRGCGVEFSVLRRDPDYYANAVVQVSGSYNVFRWPGAAPEFGLKLGVSPVASTSATYDRPAEAYTMLGIETNAGETVATGPGENGFGLYRFVYGPKSQAAVREAGRSGHLSVSYAMTKGGLASSFDVDMSVKNWDPAHPDTREIDQTTVTQWNSCIDTLLAQGTN